MAFGGAANAFKVAGKCGGPVASVAVGGFTAYNDIQTYSGEDRTRALLITGGATVVIAGAAVLTTVFAAPALVTVGVGIAISIEVDYIANNAKAAWCVTDEEKRK